VTTSCGTWVTARFSRRFTNGNAFLDAYLLLATVKKKRKTLGYGDREN